MAPPIRIEFEGAVYHVMARGNEQRAIFRSDKDRLRFLDTIEEMVDRFGVRLHAYCLMLNHYHLLLETPRGNLSQSSGWLQQTYAVRFNKRHQRSGHLFQGRFKAELVEADVYAQWLVQYIHLNPVRPKNKNQPIPLQSAEMLAKYRWSSHLDYAGRRRSPQWLCLAWLKYWGRSKQSAHRAYRQAIRQAFGDVMETRAERVRGGIAICSEKLWERVKELVRAKEGQEEEQWSRRESMSQIQQHVRSLTSGEADRRIQIWARVKLGSERSVDIAREYGYSNGSGVTLVISRLEQRASRDRKLRHKLQSLRKKCKV